MKYTTKQLIYLSHLKLTCPSHAEIKRMFKMKFGRNVSSCYITSMCHIKKAKRILDRVRERYEHTISYNFFGSKMNRVNILSELYEVAKKQQKLNVCLDIVKTFNDMYEPKSKDGDVYNIQNNEYLNMTVPELKHEIRLLSRKLGPDLLQIAEQKSSDGGTIQNDDL